jgi:pyruvate dehydrogenase E2 component (dihydrolipoamide acetyltransferase)
MAKDVLMPAVEPSMRAGRLTRWLRREGDFVEAGDPIAEIATDRATMDVEAPQSGVLVRLLVEAGAAPIAVHHPIARIDPHPAPHQHPRMDKAPAHPGDKGPAPVSPRARRLAHQAGCDLAAVAGSGPHGRIIERDVRAALSRRADDGDPARAPSSVPPPQGERAPIPLSLPGEKWAPQAHLEADCNIEALEKLRARLNESAREEMTPPISLVDCVVKALALALRRTPRVNMLHGSTGFAPARQCDIALGLAVEGRLAAPTLPSAENLTLAEIAASRAQFMAGRFPAAAHPGGSSLVLDFGDFGVKRVFPVVVAPWTLVLAIGEAENRVVVEDNVPAVAAILSVTLTIDRRAMDEIAGAMLLDAFRQLIENPYGLLL